MKVNEERCDDEMIVAGQIVNILEERGVKFVFGLPGEENISLVNALHKSDKIKYILVHDERAAGFMASTIGWLSDQPGVVIATLGPGALNMTLSIADAQTHSFPVIAIGAQADLRSRIRETTQVVDLKAIFEPITNWSEDLVAIESTTEIINKAYNLATAERKGATFVTIPASFEQEELDKPSQNVLESPNNQIIPNDKAISEASELLKEAENPIILAGLGVSREKISDEIRTFSEKHQLPVMTSFMAKGAVSDKSELSLGTVGFFIDDYINEYLTDVDLILAVGYDFAEFDPKTINPGQDKKIINLHTFVQETHEYYPINSQLIGNLSECLAKLSIALDETQAHSIKNSVRSKLDLEFQEGENNNQSPLKPVEIVHATRKAVPENGVVYIDTGAVKMWMARLYPAYDLNTIMINNALSSMSWAIPGTIAGKLLSPTQPILTVLGDGAFHMSTQEILTAKRYDIPLTILIWDDSGYGLIKWKMDMDLDEHSEVDFENPNFIQLAESYGGQGYLVESRDELEETIAKCLEKDDGLNIIVAPVDYKENMKLTEKLED